MKILQTPVRFYPSVGGVENYVYNLSKELVNLGHEVTVVCANEKSNIKKEIIDGIEVKRLNYSGKIANTNITPSLPVELIKSKFDIIHTHLPTPWSADWSTIASRILRTPLILTYHNDIVGSGFSDSIANVFNKTALKFILGRAKKIIITQPNYINFSPHLEKYENKITVIPNGVDPKRFKPLKIDKENNTISFLSVLDHYHRYKGLSYLLKAIKIVKKEIPGIKLRVGGGGELLSSYKDMAISMGLKNNIEFLGYIPEEMMAEFYNKCQIFILPSVSPAQEGFGIVLLEALACKKAVIATDIVGIADEIIKNNTGKIVKAKNEKALANAIIKILQDKELERKMGENGRRLIEEKYTWMKITKMIENIYKSIG